MKPGMQLISKGAKGPANQRIAISLILGLLAASFLLFISNNDFELGLHPDEPLKIFPILENRLRFAHPQLLMNFMRLAHDISGEQSPQALVEIGRTISACFGVLLVLFSFLLARRVYGYWPGLCIAALVATTPLISIHAHYLKEDMFMAPFFVGGIWAYLKHAEDQTRGGIIVLGVFIGLAASAKLVGAILVPALLCAAIINTHASRLRTVKDVLVASLVGGGVFLVVNYSVVFNFDQAIAQLGYEVRHGIVGHTLKIWPTDTYFVYHFLNSLVPGLSWPVAALFLLGLVSGFIPSFKFSSSERTILVALFMFYLAHEISPTKPFPASIRYMVPIAPLVVMMAGRGLLAVGSPGGRRRAAFAGSLVAVLIAVTTIQSGLLIRDLNNDTRLQDKAIKGGHLVESYTDNKLVRKKIRLTKLSGILNQMRQKLSRLDPNNASNRKQARTARVGALSLQQIRDRNIKHLVISSFVYDRFLYAISLRNQTDEVYKIAKQYEKLLTCRYREIKPRYKSFSFSNPVIRIIDVEPCLQHLSK